MTDRLEWRVAIIGYDPIRWVRYLDEYARQSGEPEPSMDNGRRKTHFVQYIDDKSLRRAFYQALLDIEWLPSKIHSAVMSELGLSLQKRKSDIEEARTLTLNVLVDECKARMRENGEPKRARRRKPETAKADLKPPLDEVGHCDHCLGTAIRMSSEELQRPTSDFRSGLARGAFHAHGAGKLKHTA